MLFWQNGRVFLFVVLKCLMSEVTHAARVLMFERRMEETGRLLFDHFAS